MKNLFYFAAVALSALALVSCSDSDDSSSACICTSTITGIETSTTYTVDELDRWGISCSDMEDQLNETAAGVYTVSCK